MCQTKQMLTMRMLTNPFKVTAHDPQPVAPGAERKSLGEFTVAFEPKSLPGNVVEFTFDYLNQQHPSPEMIHGVIAAVQASIAAADQKLSEFARILLILNPWDIDQFATAESVRATAESVSDTVRKLESDQRGNLRKLESTLRAAIIKQSQDMEGLRHDLVHRIASLREEYIADLDAIFGEPTKPIRSKNRKSTNRKSNRKL